MKTPKSPRKLAFDDHHRKVSQSLYQTNNEKTDEVWRDEKEKLRYLKLDEDYERGRRRGLESGKGDSEKRGEHGKDSSLMSRRKERRSNSGMAESRSPDGVNTYVERRSQSGWQAQVIYGYRLNPLKVQYIYIYYSRYVYIYIYITVGIIHMYI